MPEDRNPTRMERRPTMPEVLHTHYADALGASGTGPGLDWLAPHKLHVTLMWSRYPADWNHPLLAPQEGPLVLDHAPELRRHDIFGPEPENPDSPRALVLCLEDDRLIERHMELRGTGLRSDFDPFQPHITLAKIPRGLVLAELRSFAEALPVYRDAIELGPEIRMLP